MARFAAYVDVAEVISQGTTRSTVILRNQLQVDLRRRGRTLLRRRPALFYRLQKLQRRYPSLDQGMGLKVNEYGLFRGKERIAGETEEYVYAAVRSGACASR